MSRLELIAETREAVVIRLHGKPGDSTTERQRGIVVYVPPAAEASVIAAQLRRVADTLASQPR